MTTAAAPPAPLTVDEIRERITTRPRWTARAIVAITQQTHYIRNGQLALDGIGFNGCDAEFMTSLASQLTDGRRLSAKQMQIAQRIIGKYAKQLHRIAAAKAAAAAETNQ